MNDARYREWQPGWMEKLLPQTVEDFDPENRVKRLELFAANARAGAHRDICRGFIRSEEEFRAGCRMAGLEPGDGWVVRPAAVSAPRLRVVPVVEQSALVSMADVVAGEDLPW